MSLAIAGCESDRAIYSDPVPQSVRISLHEPLEGAMRRPICPGDIFSRLTVVSPVYYEASPSGQKERKAIVRCSCGNERPVFVSSLLSGNTRSCGCLKRETAAALARRHAGSHTPLYGIWTSMRDRCRNPRNPRFPGYGGRRITICAA
jgi:hypothetical protein